MQGKHSPHLRCVGRCPLSLVPRVLSNVTAMFSNWLLAIGSAIVTSHEDYIKGIKIYGIGILEDPVPGEKRGKGTQHLTSRFKQLFSLSTKT